MVEGRMRKFYEEVGAARAGLRGRPRQDASKAVVQAAAKEVGAPIEVDGLRPPGAGRGHREGAADDFAAEVAQLAGVLTFRVADALFNAQRGAASRMSEPSQPRVPTFRRVLLKMSGEALLGDGEYGHRPPGPARSSPTTVPAVHAMGVELCLVIGGGNIIRGSTLARPGLERSTADYMGMLGDGDQRAGRAERDRAACGVPTRVMSAIPMSAVCEPYIRRRAVRHLEKGRIVIFAAGTGNPFFTTDTAAALRAAEMGCDAILKGTQVDGVYSADPRNDPTPSATSR